MNRSTTFFRATTGWVLVAGLVAGQGCDSLEEEIVPNDPQSVRVEYADLYVLSQSVGVIDLTKGITSTEPVVVTIAQNPQKGQLASRDKGLYTYSPDETFIAGTDRFVINIRTEDGDVSLNDTINVVVTADITQLPCDYYAVNDHATITLPGDTTVIDVLANDVSCASHAADPETLKVVHYTSNGIASVVDGRIRFLHDLSRPFEGSILYSVNLKECSECTRFAYVMLSGDTTRSCNATVANADQLTITTSGPVTFNNENTYTRISVLNNDRFCGQDSLAQKVLTIVEPPFFGDARVDAGTDFIKYWLPLNTTIDLLDSIRYQVCVNGACYQATLQLKVRFNPQCAIYPRADSVQFAPGGAETSWMLDVIANDEVCELAEHATLQITRYPAQGSVAVENGMIRYTSASDFINESFQYTVCTTNGYCSNTSATVTVKK